MALLVIVGHFLDHELGSGRDPEAAAGASTRLSDLPPDLTDTLPPARPLALRAGRPGSADDLDDAAGTMDRDGVRTYVVRPGDSFASIARKIYGDSSAWRIIFEANRNLVPSVSKLQVGTTLRIPPAPPTRRPPRG
jgi:nucleoid-associated protein YgaU